MIRRPESDAVAVDYSESMLARAAMKPALIRGNVQFIQRDLNDGTPEDLGEFDVVSSFSATHHLLDANKNRLIKQVADSLKPGGRFIFMDAMFEMFDDDVFRQIKERELRNRKIRLTEAGVSEEYERLEQIKASLDSESPERDRFASVQHYRHSLDEAGFRSVDHIWHFWMEYLFISFK